MALTSLLRLLHSPTIIVVLNLKYLVLDLILFLPTRFQSLPLLHAPLIVHRYPLPKSILVLHPLRELLQVLGLEHRGHDAVLQFLLHLLLDYLVVLLPQHLLDLFLPLLLELLDLVLILFECVLRLHD